MKIRKGTLRTGLTDEVAAQILANVFAVCGREPNTVPFDELASYTIYRKERYRIQKWMIVLTLLLFLFLPVLFISGNFGIDRHIGAVSHNPVYDITVDTPVPVYEIRASVDGMNVPVTGITAHSYMIRPNANGTMHITAELLNRQRIETEVPVSGVDLTRPELVSTEYDDGFCYLFVRDADSEVNGGSVRVFDDEGNEYPITDYDAARGCIILPYPVVDQTVEIADTHGNVLKVRLKTE